MGMRLFFGGYFLATTQLLWVLPVSKQKHIATHLVSGKDAAYILLFFF